MFILFKQISNLLQKEDNFINLTQLSGLNLKTPSHRLKASILVQNYFKKLGYFQALDTSCFITPKVKETQQMLSFLLEFLSKNEEEDNKNESAPS